jgi:hypothetical protein
MGSESIIYFDPDIMVYHSLKNLEDLLFEFDLVLTPHFCTPQPDNELIPRDHDMLQTGVYNLGFIAIKNNEQGRFFNNWWKQKMVDGAFANLKRGLFYDQLWASFAPAFVEKVKVLRDPGYNMANWNLHERRITSNEPGFVVNDNFPLVFFHFSHYKIDNPDILASYNTRYSLHERKDLQQIFRAYRQTVIGNRYHELKKIPPVYSGLREQYLQDRLEINKKNKKLVPTMKRLAKRGLESLTSRYYRIRSLF